MKLIPLSNGKIFAMVDDEDFGKLNKRKWTCSNMYAKTSIHSNGERSQLKMDRLIMNCPNGLVVDHINGNTLDNRKENLRIATQKQNCLNRGFQRNNTSGFKGVSLHKPTRRWMVHITENGKNRHVGSFSDRVEAARAWDAEAIKIRGDFARTNKKLGLLQ